MVDASTICPVPLTLKISREESINSLMELVFQMMGKLKKKKKKLSSLNKLPSDTQGSLPHTIFYLSYS